MKPTCPSCAKLSALLDVCVAHQRVLLAQADADHPDASKIEREALRGATLTLKNTVETYRKVIDG